MAALAAMVEQRVVSGELLGGARSCWWTTEDKERMLAVCGGGVGGFGGGTFGKLISLVWLARTSVDPMATVVVAVIAGRRW